MHNCNYMQYLRIFRREITHGRSQAGLDSLLSMPKKVTAISTVHVFRILKDEKVIADQTKTKINLITISLWHITLCITLCHFSTAASEKEKSNNDDHIFSKHSGFFLLSSPSRFYLSSASLVTPLSPASRRAFLSAPSSQLIFPPFYLLFTSLSSFLSSIFLPFTLHLFSLPFLPPFSSLSFLLPLASHPNPHPRRSHASHPAQLPYST